MWPAAAASSRPPLVTPAASRRWPHNQAGHRTGITSTSTWHPSSRTSHRRTRPGCAFTGCPRTRLTSIPPRASGRCSSGPSPTSPPPTWTAWSASSSASWRRSSTGPTWSTAASPPPAWQSNPG